MAEALEMKDDPKQYLRTILTDLWGPVLPYESPPPSSLRMAVQDRFDGENECVKFLADVDLCLQQMEREGMSTVSCDILCVICQEVMLRSERDLSGPSNRRKREKLHKKMKRQGRELMSAEPQTDVLEVIPACGHFFHTACVKEQRKRCVEGDLLCAHCRHPAPYTVRTDVPIAPTDSVMYHQLICVLRSFKACKFVHAGMTCYKQRRCRFCHFLNGELLQQGEPQVTLVNDTEYLNWYYALEFNQSQNVVFPPPPPEEDWSNEEGTNVIATTGEEQPTSHLFIRPQRRRRVPRPPGTRGSGRIPVVVRATGNIIYLDEDVVVLDSRSPSPLYNRNLPPRD